MKVALSNGRVVLAALIGACLMTGCGTPVSIGNSSAKTVATGSAGGANGNNVNSSLQRCDRPVGTASFVEDTTAAWYGTLSGEYKLPSTTIVLRQLAQQSNCFVVVERGRGHVAMQAERALEQSGELREGSRFGKGQMVAADYVITPSITFSNNDTGGVNGMLAGLPGVFGKIGAVAGGIKSNEASTMLLLSDNRSGIQVATAEGSAKNFDFDASTWMWAGGGFGSLGAYSRTPEGKVLVGAFTDAFNQLVLAIKNYEPQVAPVSGKGMGTGGTLRTN